jgi:4-hydroxythreonine-4-phosphate dehydrogenase
VNRVARLAILPGDPRGIGPEVTCKVLLNRHQSGDPVDAIVVGERAAFESAAEQIGLSLDHIRVEEPVGTPVEVEAIRLATTWAQSGKVGALVTGPIHKARLAASGFAYTGHTDFLAALCGGQRAVMAFVGGSVRVALVTVHIPLREVPDAVTTEGVLHTIRTAEQALKDQLGLRQRRLVVCGLNPHAGDGGVLGSEDAACIAPAVHAAQALGIDVVGPLSSEACFRLAVAGQADLVVAMYHDQGLAPLKALDFGRSVNWTIGLPIIRTSVDHGTADDIAGQGIADPSSMGAAIALAESLTASA